jgi:hypothetical protein
MEDKINGLEALLLEKGEPLLLSQKKDVMIYGIDKTKYKVDIKGYVRSESRQELFHDVKVSYLTASRMVIYGECDCESFKYRGSPCKHIISIRDVYLANRKRLLGI